MFGDPFFTGDRKEPIMAENKTGFRPHVWGSFFHSVDLSRFDTSEVTVFVPMFGDPFFTS